MIRNQVLHGDVLERLKTLPDNSVQVCVTSPPYYGLRTYLPADHPDKPKEIGQEQTPQEYVAKIVGVFQEVRRVLHPTGVCFINLGDTYANDTKWGGKTSGKHAKALHGNTSIGRAKKATGLKAKDLIGVPWRVALALQDDGWWLRSDVIWAKGNPQPEAVQDRPTRAHEYIFMLTKAADYFYDPCAIYEPGANDESVERNRRTVWAINNRPYRGAHFATMPEEIPRLCIKAASSERGCCGATVKKLRLRSDLTAEQKAKVEEIPADLRQYFEEVEVPCGAPWKRLVERGQSHYAEVKGDRHWTDLQADAEKKGWVTRGGPTLDERGTMPSLYAAPRRELGWEPTCTCPKADPVPCLVLDPFAGSGTTLAVAKSLGRDYVGIELNPDYLPLIAERVRRPTEWQADRDVFELMMGLED